MHPIVKQHREIIAKITPIQPGELVDVHYPSTGRLRMLVEGVDLYFTRGNVAEYRPSDYVEDNLEVSLVLNPRLDGSADLRTRERINRGAFWRVAPGSVAPDSRLFKVTRKDWGPGQGYIYPAMVIEKFDAGVDREVFATFVANADLGEEITVGQQIVWRIA